MLARKPCLTHPRGSHNGRINRLRKMDVCKIGTIHRLVQVGGCQDLVKTLRRGCCPKGFIGSNPSPHMKRSTLDAVHIIFLNCTLKSSVDPCIGALDIDSDPTFTLILLTLFWPARWLARVRGVSRSIFSHQQIHFACRGSYPSGCNSRNSLVRGSM